MKSRLIFRNALLGSAALAMLSACNSSVSAPQIPGTHGTVATPTPTPSPTATPAGPGSTGTVTLGSGASTSTLAVAGAGMEAIMFPAVAGGGKLSLAASVAVPAGVTPLSFGGIRTLSRARPLSVTVTPLLYTKISNAGTSSLTLPVPTLLYTPSSPITGTFALYDNAGSGWMQVATATGNKSASLTFTPAVASVTIPVGGSITVALAQVSGTGSGLTVLPGSATLLAGQSTVFTVSETGAQSFTATSSSSAATVAPAGPVAGGQQSFTVTAGAAGSAMITVADDAADSAVVAVTVVAGSTVIASTATAQNLPAATGITNPQLTITGGAPSGKQIVVSDTAAGGPAGLPALPSPLTVNAQSAVPVFGLEGTTLSDLNGAGAAATTLTSVSGFTLSATLAAVPSPGTRFSVLFYTPPIPLALAGGWAVAAGSSCAVTSATVACTLPLGSSSAPFQVPGGLNFGLEIVQISAPPPTPTPPPGSAPLTLAPASALVGVSSDHATLFTEFIQSSFPVATLDSSASLTTPVVCNPAIAQVTNNGGVTSAGVASYQLKVAPGPAFTLGDTSCTVTWTASPSGTVATAALPVSVGGNLPLPQGSGPVSGSFTFGALSVSVSGLGNTAGSAGNAILTAKAGGYPGNLPANASAPAGTLLGSFALTGVNLDLDTTLGMPTILLSGYTLPGGDRHIDIVTYNLGGAGWSPAGSVVPAPASPPIGFSAPFNIPITNNQTIGVAFYAQP
jgi:hypothetical protein